MQLALQSCMCILISTSKEKGAGFVLMFCMPWLRDHRPRVLERLGGGGDTKIMDRNFASSTFWQGIQRKQTVSSSEVSLRMTVCFSVERLYWT